MSTSDAVAALVEPVLAAEGRALYDVEHTGATIRVMVEGAALDELERLSPKVAAVLDEADVMPGQWYLEVSSPGLERPLRRPAHFRGALGTTVRVKTRPGVEGDRRVEGELTAADDEGIEVAGRRLAYADIERARTVFEWGGAPKPGAKQRSKA